MRRVVFTTTAQARITGLHSPRFTADETMDFQIRLVQTIQNRLLYIRVNEGYREYIKGPWAKTRRIIVEGYRVYYELNEEKDLVIVKGIKAPSMK